MLFMTADPLRPPETDEEPWTVTPDVTADVGCAAATLAALGAFVALYWRWRRNR